ncbi:sulfite exporter TauE/SafE family protein [Alteromonas pelagimontana]|uniref:Sulfite exporter TauE/SafE family protein n=1 Tax=Alteromonas pelagimontana TaxID=1858656 RepID=A0A6M4MI12_9ALTE|nr:sulfite exporter TauE/SafE family protein [Alteromonas pelagimontana]QJR79304.1 sulfite exporter TauE/SafE family protein [Alteromonas pelagimontana]QJR82662.1 sulfite exporter TauE/SafE family protein [Alteromonas pelagimontana]
MIETDILSAFLIGLAGGVHCVGMCGGIATALRVVTPPNANPWPYTLSYNIGRISSYTAAGAITGAIGQISTSYLPIAGPVLAIFSSLMLLALACYLGQWWQGLRVVEKAGSRIWKRIQPISKRFLPFRTPLHALPYGMIWGWLPCGLVYSTLTWALASGSAADGALVMLCFGLGTLPTLLAASAGAKWLVSGFRNPVFRQMIAFLLFAYASWLMVKAIASI